MALKKYVDGDDMQTKSSDEHISNRAWFRNVLAGENVILRGISVGFFVNKKDENLQNRLKAEYQEAMEQALDDYMFLCKNIGMSTADIVAAVEKRLQGGNDDGSAN